MVVLQKTKWIILQQAQQQGGLAARSGTEFTWSPQLRNLAEWDWVPFSFKTNMAENAVMEGRWVFARFWVFPCPNQEKVFKNIFNGIFGHQEAWFMNIIGDYTYRDSTSRQVQ